ncbi:Alginate biosynthesis protein AlgA [bioreactor metagenome]|uniref:Alginate biosynthesis protein AlgA n=1 Tax=bioreactor metagenome TaxID=1076179 RepID=A0A645CLH3_9ZZZZ
MKSQEDNNLDRSSNYKKTALILAGASDSKFWPRSTKKYPEQFICLLEDTSLFQKTFKLINSKFDLENIRIVINDMYKDIALEQINELKDEFIIIEPFPRHTAPAIGLSLIILDEKYSDDTVFCIFPSDQYVKNIEEFYLSIDVACQAAYLLNGLITIGIEPTRPETHYGYIQYNENNVIKNYGSNQYSQADNNFIIPEELFKYGLRKSINFAEKPDKITAQRFIESGDFIWNSGILVARKDVLFNAFEKFLNYHYEQFRSIQKFIGTKEFNEEVTRLYKTFNKISVDYGILESAENVFVVKSTFSWTDLNDWDELYRISLKDALDNVLMGNIIAIDSKNSLAISDDKLIAMLGIDDIVVVNTDNAILLCKRGETRRIDEILEFIKKKNIPLY